MLMKKNFDIWYLINKIINKININNYIILYFI